MCWHQSHKEIKGISPAPFKPKTRAGPAVLIKNLSFGCATEKYQWGGAAYFILPLLMKVSMSFSSEDAKLAHEA